MTDTAVRICPPDHKHGQSNTCRSNHHCQCEECRAAHREYARKVRREKAYGRYESSLISARGAHRRIQALARQGWSQKRLGDRLGWAQQRVNQVLAGRLITKAVHARIDELFRELWDKTPEAVSKWDLASISRTRAKAAAAGWPRPLDWDDIDNDEAPAHVSRSNDDVDHTAVELAVGGTVVRLTPAERRAAVRILHGHGLTDPDIATRLACSDRTVLRIRHGELHLPANTETSAA